MEQLIKCLSELEKLKTVERGLNVGNRKESSAEHSWSCILIADILMDYVDEPLNKLKVFEYLLYHDLVEIYAGDAKFNNQEEMKLKRQKEERALEMITSILPDANRFQKLMSEYEHRQSREAEYAKAIDCIDSCIRNLNDHSSSKKDGFTESLIREKYYPHVSKFPFLLDLFNILMIKLVELDKV